MGLPERSAFGLYMKIALSYYDAIRKTVKSNNVKNKLSDTLITKTLMVTLGCVPAYDRLFVEDVKDQSVPTGINSSKIASKSCGFL